MRVFKEECLFAVALAPPLPYPGRRAGHCRLSEGFAGRRGHSSRDREAREMDDFPTQIPGCDAVADADDRGLREVDVEDRLDEVVMFI